MNPNIGRRAGLNRKRTEKKPSAVRDFVEMNTHKNITMKREYMYLEDVKEAININTLEERIKLKKWLKTSLQGNASKAEIVRVLEEMTDKERHRLQKQFHIRIK